MAAWAGVTAVVPFGLPIAIPAARAFVLVAHAIFPAAPLGLVITEPRGDLIAGAVEEAAVIGVVASAAPVATRRSCAVGIAVVGPSGLLIARPVARVITVIG